MSRLLHLLILLLFLASSAAAQLDGEDEFDWNEDGLPDRIVVEGGCLTILIAEKYIVVIERIKTDINGDPVLDDDGFPIIESIEEERIRYVPTESICPDSRWLDIINSITLGNIDGDPGQEQYYYDPTTGTYRVTESDGSTRTLDLALIGGVNSAGHYSSGNCVDASAYSSTFNTYTFSSCLGYGPGAVTFGGRGGDAVPGDYNGDGREDPAIYDPVTNRYIIRLYTDAEWEAAIRRPIDQVIIENPPAPTTANSIITVPAGSEGDIPSPADFNGDGITELAVYDPESSQFTVYNPNGTPTETVQVGEPGDIPMPLDLIPSEPGDEFAVYRPATESFIVENNAGQETEINLFGISLPASLGPSALVGVRETFRYPNSRVLSRLTPVPSDFDGDRKSDLATYYIRTAGSDGVWTLFRGNNAISVRTLGQSSSHLLAADTDADGAANSVAVDLDSQGNYLWKLLKHDASIQTELFGREGDQILLGDIDCDGRADRVLARSTPNGLLWLAQVTGRKPLPETLFGASSGQAFLADMDGDQCEDLVVAEPSGTEYRWNALGAYHRQSILAVSFGSAGDTLLPPLDFTGDGRADLIISRANGAERLFFVRSARGTVTQYALGLATDLPLVGFFSGVNHAELAAFRSTSTGASALIRKFNGSIENKNIPGAFQRIISPVAGKRGTSLSRTTSSPPTGGSKPDAFGCTSYIPARDGALGFEWRPTAGKLKNVSLFAPSQLANLGRSVDLVAKNRKLAHRLRFKSNDKSGRALFLGKTTAKALRTKFGKSFTLRFGSNGSATCIRLGDPTKKAG